MKSYTHTLTQSVAAFWCVDSDRKLWGQTDNFKKDPSISCFGSIFKSVFCYIDVFFYKSLLTLLDAEAKSLSTPEFFTAIFSRCFNLWGNKLCNL